MYGPNVLPPAPTEAGVVVEYAVVNRRPPATTEYTPVAVGHSVNRYGAPPRPCTEWALQVKLEFIGGGVGGGEGMGGVGGGGLGLGGGGLGPGGGEGGGGWQAVGVQSVSKQPSASILTSRPHATFRLALLQPSSPETA